MVERFVCNLRYLRVTNEVEAIAEQRVLFNLPCKVGNLSMGDSGVGGWDGVGKRVYNRRNTRRVRRVYNERSWKRWRRIKQRAIGKTEGAQRKR
jgi:hypothetical protein